MDTKSLSLAITQFSAKFCNELEKNKSVVCSPLSTELVLALLTLGATEPAHSQLLTALGVADDHAIRSSFSAMVSKMKSIKGVNLNIANKIYVMYITVGAYDLQPQFKEDAINIFDVEMEKVDFSNSAAAVNYINAWVEDKTNQKIKYIMSNNSVDSNTHLVMINAIYFKGEWKDKFSRRYTKKKPFHLDINTTVQVPMMYNSDDYSHGHSKQLKAALLELPYLGNETSMLVVLPREIEGLNDVLTKLAAGHDLMADITNMHKHKVCVTLPKFKIETEINLKDLLQKLGILDIFDRSKSGLTKMLNCSEPLYVSNAVQKAFIEVNEKGAEAAAATGFQYRVMRARPRFTANRPFLYMLLGADRVPLFIGVYCGDGVTYTTKRRKLE